VLKSKIKIPKLPQTIDLKKYIGSNLTAVDLIILLAIPIVTWPIYFRYRERGKARISQIGSKFLARKEDKS